MQKMLKDQHFDEILSEKQSEDENQLQKKTHTEKETSVLGFNKKHCEWMKQKFSVKKISTRVSKKILWHSFRATIIGVVLILVGTSMAIMGT